MIRHQDYIKPSHLGSTLRGMFGMIPYALYISNKLLGKPMLSVDQARLYESF